jgi:hypothetical protein
MIETLGRPTRWSDDPVKDAGVSWIRVADCGSLWVRPMSSSGDLLVNMLMMVMMMRMMIMMNDIVLRYIMISTRMSLSMFHVVIVVQFPDPQCTHS